MIKFKIINLYTTSVVTWKLVQHKRCASYCYYNNEQIMVLVHSVYPHRTDADLFHCSHTCRLKVNDAGNDPVEDLDVTKDVVDENDEKQIYL